MFDNQKVIKELSVPKTKVSVVIPTYNRVATVQRAIRSVLAQSRPADEIIVVDDGSDDGTRDMVKAMFGDSLQYYYQANRGVSAARNLGIEKSSGHWVALLDSDDEWMPEKLQQQLHQLEQNPEYNFCHTNEIWIRRGKRVNPMMKHEKSGGFIFERCLPLCVISPSSVLIRRTVFENVGFFDEDLPACEDYDFWLRYCSQNPVLFIEEALIVKYGGHSDQLSKKFTGMDVFRLRALVNLVASGALSSTQLEAVKKTFVEKLDILTNGAKKHANDDMLQACERIEKEMKVHFEQMVGSNILPGTTNYLQI